MPDIFLPPTADARRNGENLVTAIRTVHHHGGGIVHAGMGTNYELTMTIAIPDDVSVVFDIGPKETPPMGNERYIIQGELEYWTNDGMGAELTLGEVPWPGPDIHKCQGKYVQVTVEVLDYLDASGRPRRPGGDADATP